MSRLPREPARPAAPPTRRRVRPAAGGVLLGLLLILLAPAAPAAAHAYLAGSDPPDGAVLPTAPSQVVLTFSEPVRPVLERIMVVAPDGATVGGQPRADGARVVIPLDRGAARGTYLVSYRVVSTDGHPIAGGVSFSVGAPSPPPPLPTGQDVDEGLRTATGVVRYLGHAGLVLVVGPALVLALLWPQRLSRRGPARVLWLGTGLVGAATLAGLWLYAPYTAGRTLSGVTVTDLREVLASTYGQAHLVRLGVLAAAVWLLRPLAAGRAGRGDLVLLGVLAVLGLGTWPVAGHPVASPLPAVSIAVTTVHLAAAAVWIGGLVVLAGFLLRRADERELGAILPIWSGWAAAAVTALLLTGLIQALIEVGTPDALLTATYGRLLLVKVALVAVVIGVAGYSRRLVRRRVAAARPGGVRRAVVLEAGLLAVVVAVAAALTQTTPARIEAAAGPGAVTGAVFSTTLESPLYSLQVSVEPAARGANAVHLYAFSPAGEPLPVVEWGAGVGLPDAGIEEVEVSLLPLTDNHATGEVVLPVAGEWQFRFTLRISEIDQASVSVVVPISEEF